jgi:hypothetical protein
VKVVLSEVGALKQNCFAGVHKRFALLEGGIVRVAMGVSAIKGLLIQQRVKRRITATKQAVEGLSDSLS